MEALLLLVLGLPPPLPVLLIADNTPVSRIDIPPSYDYCYMTTTTITTLAACSGVRANR